MFLSNLAEILQCKKIPIFKKNTKIGYISANSKKIKKNSVFVVDYKKKIKKTYLHEAIKKGAVAIITNKNIKDINVPQFIVKNISLGINQILYKIKPFPPNNIIAITGTNGKTSVVWLTSNIIKSSNLNVYSLGTLGFYKNLKKIEGSQLTTPEKEELHQAAFSSSLKKIEFIFEASSHGIAKKRINNLPINIAAITNISRDHLDYHKTFTNYRNTKFKLFLNYLSNAGVAILNDNVKNINILKKTLNKKNIKIISFGKKNSDINCIFFKNKIKIKIFSKVFFIKYTATAEFELQNLSCSIACCLAIGLNTSQVIKSLPKIKEAEGRMQLVNKLYNGAKVFVDYAHTPSALKTILKSNLCLKKKPDIVFGCGGERDKAKRVLMGKIANKHAKRIYITNDNPRNENPNTIRKIIHSQCSRALNISDRRIAIKSAIYNLNSTDILIIAGKGHEKKQIIKNKIINFDDVKVANYYIKKKNFKY